MDLSGPIAAKLAKHCTMRILILIRKRFDSPICISGFALWKISDDDPQASNEKILGSDFVGLAGRSRVNERAAG